MTNERQIIYDLIEHLGGFENSTVVLKDLIKFLNTDQITEFVEYFIDNHDITIPGYETYELCMDCQDTYEVNSAHVCNDTQPPQGTSKFFSSMVPEC